MWLLQKGRGTRSVPEGGRGGSPKNMLTALQMSITTDIVSIEHHNVCIYVCVHTSLNFLNCLIKNKHIWSRLTPMEIQRCRNNTKCILIISEGIPLFSFSVLETSELLSDTPSWREEGNEQEFTCFLPLKVISAQRPHSGATVITSTTFGLSLIIRGWPLIRPRITVGRSLFLTLAQHFPEGHPHLGGLLKVCWALSENNSFL